MKIQVDRNDACEASLTVEIDPSMVEPAMQQAARRLSEKGNLHGFRKGKAPYSVVLNAFGEETLLEEALDALGPEVYRLALEEEKLEPSAVGTMKRIVSRNPLILEYLVPLKPEVTLGDFRSIRLPFEEPVIPEEAVDRALEQLRQSHSILEPVNRPAQTGDVLVLDVKAEAVTENGKTEALVFEGEENPVELDLDENLGGRYPGAGPSLEGIVEGESRTVEIQYPETFPIARLRNMRVRLTVRCLGVKNRLIPDWSEELVKSVSELSSVDDLRKEIRSRMESRAREEKEEEYADQVIDKMLEGAKIKYPSALLEEELDESLQVLERRLQRRKMSLEVYLRTIPDGMSGLRKEMEPDVRRKLAHRLFLTEAIKQEGLEPSDEEIQKQMEIYRQAFSEGKIEKSKEVKSFEEVLHNLAANDVLARLIVQRVVQIGRGITTALPKS